MRVLLLCLAMSGCTDPAIDVTPPTPPVLVSAAPVRKPAPARRPEYDYAISPDATAAGMAAFRTR